ncbi:MAG: F0F1 ATP synthase subunit gamma [Clostridia bacterium]|nr:F0F1 ATP synthase subunit gamma [Clostridia bacterium]
MASLRELKKKLESVRMTGQLAGALKTASAVKFARISGSLNGYEAYASAARELKTKFGAALAEAYPVKSPDAPRCFVLLGANRGLSGGANVRLYDFADRLIEEAEGEARPRSFRGGVPLPLLIVAGRHAVNRFREQCPPGAKNRIRREFDLPDVPAAEDAAAILAEALALFGAGEVSSVEVISLSFVNMLTQTPSTRVLLPLVQETETPADDGTLKEKKHTLFGAPGGKKKTSPPDDVLFVPNRDAVLRAAADTCVSADFYGTVLENAAAAQAATLVAMRTASDNAEQNAASLESDISRRRQSEVTAGVIETAGARKNDPAPAINPRKSED